MAKKKQYRWNAEDYARHSSAQQSWAGELISKLDLQGDEAVPDIGCWEGWKAGSNKINKDQQDEAE
ncbi:MAG: hypothetical protein ACL93V_01930 [Candidatus Electrothrix sp. YB6]